MSRIGNKEIPVSGQVNVTINGRNVVVKGPKGELSRKVSDRISVKVENNAIVVERPDDSKESKAFHGLERALLANLVKGVSEGFVKKLEIQGVGYRVQLKGNSLDFTIGKSHPVIFDLPAGISATVDDPTHFSISGIDKQLVGQVSANIRSLYPPEPYKGKGIRYVDEYVLRKAGKTAK